MKSSHDHKPGEKLWQRNLVFILSAVFIYSVLSILFFMILKYTAPDIFIITKVSAVPAGYIICTAFSSVLLAITISVYLYIKRGASIVPFFDFSKILRQAASGDLTCRYPCRNDGSVVDGMGCDFNLLMNFIKENADTMSEQYQNIEMLAHRYRIVAEYSNSVIFDCDISTGTVTYNENFVKLFGYAPDWEKTEFLMLHPDRIHEEDMEAYRIFCRQFCEEAGNHSAEIRVESADGHYLWCLIELTSFSESGDKPKRAVGRVSDISSQKTKYQELVYRSQMDLLTGFYNKLSGRQIINDTLEAESDSMHAMLVLDIDDFKEINDTFGHLYGDTVIVECSERLRAAFRKSDILCRFGGDEYIIFLKNVPSEEFVVEKMMEISDVLCYSLEYEGRSFTASLSAGISFFPEHGSDYESLYEKSDRALYHSKRTGKKKFMVYNDSIGEQFEKAILDSYSNATIAKGFSQRSFAENAISNVFNILYESTDLEHSIRYVLSTLAGAYHVDVIHVIRITDKDSGYTVLYKASQGRNACEMTFPVCDISGFLSIFESSNEFICEDISMLPKQQRLIFNKGRTGACFFIALPSGAYVMFDIMSQPRSWDEESTAILSSAAKIIDVFIPQAISGSGASGNDDAATGI